MPRGNPRCRQQTRCQNLRGVQTNTRTACSPERVINRWLLPCHRPPRRRASRFLCRHKPQSTRRYHPFPQILRSPLLRPERRRRRWVVTAVWTKKQSRAQPRLPVTRQTTKRTLQFFSSPVRPTPGEFAPGFEKRIIPFPLSLEQRLGPPPAGLRRGSLGDRAVLYDPATSEIVDSFVISLHPRRGRL